MRNYTVYFELFGKKLKVSRILAENEADAKRMVSDKIQFHKVEIDTSDPFNQCMDVADGISGVIHNR